MHSAVIPSILSYPAMPLAEQLVHQRYVHPGPLVLRTALIGEQPNPWDLLQPQDVMSRHRGAKHCRR